MLSQVEVQGDWRLFFVMIPVAIAIWWIAKEFDLARITAYGKERGWRFEEITYHFLGSGNDDRLYSVRYIDEHGDNYTAGCRTSVSTGVYFTEVKLIGRLPKKHSRRQGDALDCPRCGVLIGEFQSACPNCGTERTNHT